MQMSHPAGRKTKSVHGVKRDKVQNIYRLTCSLVMKKAKLYPVDGQDTIYPLFKCFRQNFLIIREVN